MNPEAQKMAIAEACGFEKKEAPKHVFYWYKPNTFPNGAHGISNLPDYLNDLNAMHEAEKELSNEQCDRYETFLIRAATGIEVDWITGKAKQITSCQRYSFHATAAQRAEAFLRTIGKWTDDQQETK